MHMGEAVANALGGSYMQVRFVDLIREAPADERTGDEVALDVIKRAGLHTKE